MQRPDKLRVMLSGGGTGGHIFPAIAIAHAIRRKVPDAEFLFVGAEGRMEMEKVPAAGFRIEGLWISGLQRSFTIDNLSFPLKVISSRLKARKIIKSFKPQLVIGTGGYASWPTLRAASALGIPTVIQEQNSYPGITNKMLAKKVRLICVAYEGMERFFPASKIHITGNPIRQDISRSTASKAEALQFFGLKEGKTTLFVTGGSLGARTINQSLLAGLQKLAEHDIQLIWQTGKGFAFQAAQAVEPLANKGMFTAPFISRMDLAYKAADIVISRAGATSISEICAAGKPGILVPSPNVTEDHQTRNAEALSKKNAALLVADKEAETRLIKEIIKLAEDSVRMNSLSSNAKSMALPDAADTIASLALQLISPDYTG
jgi:UDP-N-acetylglucosamine--N-acetylmuramyl-(pentapeptide) pyrophosphoryl-undecaprenol N-acetylglucosamine transferase